MARPKVKYYGAYPAGFLERARALIGVTINDPVLHVCAGKVRDYPYPERAVGPNDGTIDLDPATEPDFLMDVRQLGVEKGELFPNRLDGKIIDSGKTRTGPHCLWAGVLLDRPYTPVDHEHYAVPDDVFPDNLNDLLKRCLSVVRPGGRVGVLDYRCPQPPRKGVKFVAAIAVLVGFNNNIRCYSVFERVAERPDLEKK